MTPMEIASRLGRSVTGALGKATQKDLGQFMTPAAIARLTAERLVADGFGKTVRVLEPAAGAGILACAVCEALAACDNPPATIELTLFEIDRAFEAALNQVLPALGAWLANKNITLVTALRFDDYVLTNAHALSAGLFGHGLSGNGAQVDLIISNPPYFKLAKDAPQAVACASVVHGQPNIYGFFMAIGAASLAPEGRLAFIVPRSFASGHYFRLFRERFFSEVRPESVHVFHSRVDAFAEDEVLQENVIFVASKQPGWSKTSDVDQPEFIVTTSQGLADLSNPESFLLRLDEVLDIHSRDKVLCIPSTSKEVAVFKRLRHWSGNLHRYGWDISTGPVVPFRATGVIINEAAPDAIPLLWMQNVQCMLTTWPAATRKAQYLRDCADSASIVLPNKNYVLMRRFSPKEQERRLMVAPILAEDLPFARVGLENHLNYIHKPKGNLTAEEIFGLAALLNSHLIDAWFRSTNGNTQVSATELRAMPLPSLEAIHAIGREAMHSQSLTEIDEKVERLTTNRERENAGSLHFPARCVPAVTRCTVSLQYPDNFSVSVTKREAIASV